MDQLTIQYRKFGLMVGGVFVVIACWPMIVRGEALRVWALGLAAALMLPAVVYPKSLRPVYRAWMTIGHWLGWINTRILLGIIFFGLITPLGIVTRLARTDPMRRRYEKTLDSYRVMSRPRSGSHMSHQF